MERINSGKSNSELNEVIYFFPEEIIYFKKWYLF